MNDAQKRRLLSHVAQGAAASDPSTEALRLQVLQAPRADRRPFALAAPEFNDTRTDDYYWWGAEFAVLLL